MKPKGLAKTLLGTSALTAAIVVSFLTPCAQAGTNWVGDTSIDWNDPLNWSGDTLYATGNAITINTSTGNIATVTANPTVNPGDIFVGQTGTTGRLDVRSGLVRNNVIGANGNWNFIGTGGTSANGTLNIADTSVTGQANLTTFGQGSGSYTGGKFWIGGRDGTAGGTGVMNINTTGTIAAESTDNFGTLAAANSQAAGIILGTGATGNGTVNLVNGTVNSTSAIWVGNNGGTGLWNQAGGTTNTSSLTIARWAGTGTVNMNGGTFNATGLNTRTGLAGGGSDINGGDVSVVVSRGANNAATQQGTLNIGGTGVFNSTNDVLIAFAGASTSYGEVNVNTGGTLNVGTSAKKWLIINRYDTTQGRLNVDGGTVNLQNNTDIRFSTGGGTGTSFVTLKNGGQIVGGAGSVIDLNYAGNVVNNTVNLDGGTLTIGQVVRTGTATGTRVFNFNGGTLKAAGSSTGFFATGVASAANVRDGGAIIDSNGFDVTVGQALLHSNIGGDNAIDGGLTKNGLGTLTLGGVNTYTGATTINAGTLALGATASLASTQITTASGATFDVSAVSGYTIASGTTLTNNGTVNGGFTVANGGTLNGSGTFNNAVTVDGALNPGNSPGSQTYASGLTLGNASTTTMEIAGLNGVTGIDFDFINVTGGTLTLDGSLTIVSFGGHDIGAQTAAYNLFDFVTGAGDFDTVTVDGNALAYSVGTDDWSATVGDVTYNFAESTGMLSVTVVPEPAATLLGGLGLLGLLRRRRQG